MNHRALSAIVGESPAIVGLRELIRTVAPSRLAVLIEGPTGAGKELVAAAIHELSRRTGSFVPFNVCAIGDSVFEDALFGHVRGAFTGAIGDTLGFLREANGGTVFMDEVSGLQLSLQAKLLRAIEMGQFRPVGAKRDVKSDFRVIAAANESVSALIARGRLRVDLAHRLSGAIIRVPPVRDRLEDLPLLVGHFMRGMGVEAGVDANVIALMNAHTWPGNVRELRNVVECSCTLGGLTVQTVAALLGQSANGDGRELSRREELRAALEANHWNARSAARLLGVDRATVYRWIKRSNLRPPQDSQ